MKEKRSEKLLNLLYPRHCPVCHDIALPVGKRICTGCRTKLVPISEPRCFCCSKSLADASQEYCRNCLQVSHHFERGMGIFSYSPVIQKSLYQLKYGQRQEYGIFYGEVLAFYAKEQIARWSIELLIPIPLHRKRREKRGYNQAEVLAWTLGKKLQLPVDTRSLLRKKNTKPQKELEAKERKQNMRDAFRVPDGREKFLKGKNILLVDDIYTTGATIDSAAKCLKQAGANKVYFLTVAIGGGFDQSSQESFRKS